MEDSYGREINYARISVTDLCNLRCRYCMPEEGVCKKSHGEILSVEQLALVSEALSELGVSKQRITGGEPLVRRGLIELLTKMGANPNLADICVTTNGLLLPEYAHKLREAGVGRINISLDTLDAEKYKDITRGGDLAEAIKGIDAAAEEGFILKLNAVLLRGVNDCEIRSFAEFSRSRNIPVRFIELMPFNNRQDYSKERFISAQSVVKAWNLKFIDKSDGNKTAWYEFNDGLKIGFIAPVSRKFCVSCNRIRITADGKLLLCLHHNEEYDLKPYLSDKEELKEFIVRCVLNKPKEHLLCKGVLQKRNMENIGG